jgi:hypothetical protein
MQNPVVIPQGLNLLRKDAAGKETIPQRLKPKSICGNYGTTKVVP